MTEVQINGFKRHKTIIKILSFLEYKTAKSLKFLQLLLQRAQSPWFTLKVKWATEGLWNANQRLVLFSVSFIPNSKIRPMQAKTQSSFSINNFIQVLQNKLKYRGILKLNIVMFCSTLPVYQNQSKRIVKIQKSIFPCSYQFAQNYKINNVWVLEVVFPRLFTFGFKIYDTSISLSIKLKLPCKQVNRHFKHAKNTVKTPIYSTCIFTYHFRCKVQNQIKLAAKDTLASCLR